MSILNTIIEYKKKEVEVKKKFFPVSKLETSVFFNTIRPSFIDAIASPGPSVIAEFKRKSPSKGIINSQAEIHDVAKGYEEAGVSAMSILTDLEFFGGDELDLQAVAEFSSLPLLRKDFIIDKYQIIESKAIGASAVLLIAAVLSKKEVEEFSDLAEQLGLGILFEIHDPFELDKLNPNIKIIGINNRNLNTFSIDMGHSQELIRQLPKDCLKVAESGLSSYDEVQLLYSAGFDAFLIGENFMRSPNPGHTAKKFIKGLKQEIG